ncbi:hypothetical protein [Natronomonas sp. LN261]|jgi:hypothetical protein|uniref:hypothetical protein n=1 Tax=Natronomonas sp. LN261 TaxID=2750669 RepID=UPI0015EEED27|nr:hypothetical protein [Natronomonas sp. LN261]
MTRGRDTVIGVVVVYVGVSLAAGTVAFAGARWAHAHFLAAATGDAVEELGPAFIETVLIGLAVTASVLAPVVSVVVGITLGRGLFAPVRAIGTAAVTGLVGAVLVGATVATLGSAGTPIGTIWTRSFLLTLAVAAVASAVSGAIGAAVGARAG